MRKILVATPIYSMAVADLTVSVMSAIFLLDKNGIQAEWAPLYGCCYVHTARNKLAQAFLDREDFTEILWWDADIGVPAEDVLRLVKHDKALVGGAAPFREGHYSGFPAEVKRRDGLVVGLPDEGLVEAEVIPTAMLKVKREVFETLRSAGLAPLRVEWDRETGKETLRWNSYFDFETDEELHVEYGEDVTFCRKCQKVGYELWLEPNMTIRHHGLNYRVGNLDQSLRGANT